MTFEQALNYGAEDPYRCCYVWREILWPEETSWKNIVVHNPSTGLSCALNFNQDMLERRIRRLSQPVGDDWLQWGDMQLTQTEDDVWECGTLSDLLQWARELWQ